MLTGNQLRQKYIDFFINRNHKQIPSAPLVPENDPTTLFTSSGMQPLIPYLLGLPHPLGKRLVNSQKSFRAQDIDEVGNSRHTTFFEMLGNWSLGDYFKQEQLIWFYEFLTKEIGLSPQNLYVSVFTGISSVPRDNESFVIWKNLGMPDNHIFFYDDKKNWWSRSGEPSKMPAGEPGGPDSEVFYDFGTGLNLHQKSPWKDEKCHPNCQCGRFLEIGNSVFMQYQKQADGSLKELPQKNVDFGGGLERTLAAIRNNPDIFQTDLFLPIIKKTEDYCGISYTDSAYQTSFRIIADHIKAAVMLVADGVIPSNKTQGYILRRLIRRAAVKMRKITDKPITEFGRQITSTVGDIYRNVYLDDNKISNASLVISDEIEKFDRVLNRGLREISKHGQLDGKIAFDLLQSYGFPWELTYECATERGQQISLKDFQLEFEKHQALSRTASAGMFKGGLQNHSEITTKYHTTTHLLHQALREILGNHIQQKGSNITTDRLRFDFSHPEKLTPDQTRQVETVINQNIKADLPVTKEEMPKTQALARGALAFFPEKYPDLVSVYTIGNANLPLSREICGGPHVTSTGKIGRIKIIKEESAGAGVRRIYARIISSVN